MAISFPTSPSNGNTFTDSLSGATYIYVSPPGVWNKVLSVNTSVTGTSTGFTGDGVTGTYNLPSSLATVADAVVTLNGVLQIPTTHYTYTSNTITFNPVPDSGDLIEIRKFNGGVSTSIVTSIQNLTINPQSSSYTLTTTDNGTMVHTSANVTVPNNVFTQGQSISIYNNSTSNVSIFSGTGVTMYLTGTSNTSTRTLVQRGLSSIICVNNNIFLITGGGVY